MYTYIMRHYKVSQVTGEVPQHMVFVPETLSPYFTEPAVEIRHTGRKQDKPMKNRSSLAVALLNHGDMMGMNR